MTDAPQNRPEITDAAGVAAFWFALAAPGKKDDARVAAALRPWHARAAAGELDAWAETPRKRLALILLLDQVPRHLFRDRPETYATDAEAQGLTRRFFAADDWRGFAPRERFYAALPYLHAEQPGHQERVNPVIHACAAEIPQLWFMGRTADLYLETIRRFGRFPHRNALLGRESTPEERCFLAEDWARRRGPPRRKAPEKSA